MTTDNREVVALGLAYAFARGAQRDSACAYLQKLDQPAAGYDYSLVLFELGENDSAFATLEASLRRNGAQMERIAIDPTAVACAAMRATTPSCGDSGSTER